MKPALRFVAMYLLASAVLGGIALLSSFPWRPSAGLGWIALFVLAVPITLVGELAGEVLFHNRVTQAIEHRPHALGFSWVRIGYLLVLGPLVAAAVVGFSHFSSLAA